MRTTVTIDDALWERAESFFGPEEKSALIRRALQEMIQREAGRRLAALGGSDPGAWAAPRRRPPHYLNPE
jgi:Arc/MetJ family transcription regulator